jgi:hypothetical protein
VPGIIFNLQKPSQDQLSRLLFFHLAGRARQESSLTSKIMS